MKNKSALIIGATGLIGNELLLLLLQSDTYEHVTVLVRKPVAIQHPKLTQLMVDFNQMENFEDAFAVHDVFCCLGTTIKKAGSQAAFKLVDFDYPLKAAQLAKKQGARQYFIVSAIGADSRSKVFYSRTKGEIEDALRQLKFPSLHIFHPSLLLGKRNEFRLGEKVAALLSPVFSPLMMGSLKNYKPIQAKEVAQAMVAVAKGNQSGEFIYEWTEMKEIGK
ncbi:oxidoreductase [Fontibacillus sp. BL9]|uniref:oxidoreductase n=1 Tax=Fontibacillus sp. BL9 TaxID=3389971 RepID=UPI00397B5CFA